MKYFYEPGPLNNTADLVREFQNLSEKSVQFLRGIPADRFFAHPEQGWSIAENVKHLSKTTWPITMGLRLPSAIPSVIFGKGTGSRSFEEIRKTYYASLKGGFQAGIYTPGKAAPGQSEHQEKLISKLQNSISDLVDAFSKLDDVVLDSVRMPHPAIGRITIREMLYSSLNHDIHHMSIIAARAT
jgi:hypothetical protein